MTAEAVTVRAYDPGENRCSHIKKDGLQCRAGAMAGFEKCVTHSGENGGPQRRKRKTQKAMVEVAAMARELDVPAPVDPADFPALAGEYVARFNRVFSRLESELDEIRELGLGETWLVREYSDILDRQHSVAVMVTRMMNAAAALGVSNAAKTTAEVLETEKYMQVLDLIFDTLEPWPDALKAVGVALREKANAERRARG